MPRTGRKGALEGFVFYLQTQGRAKPTIKNYTGQVRRWLEWCAEQGIDPNKVTSVQIMNYLGYKAATWLPSTTRLATLSLRVYYDYLKGLKVLKTNPARQIAVKKQVTRPVQQLEPHEVKRLIGACETLEDRAMILLLVGGGLRRSEVLGITREDIDFAHGTIRIWGKGGKWREIAPGKAAMEAVKLALGWRPQLFTNTHDDSVRNRLRLLAQRAGIEKPIHPHMLRYFFAVHFCEAGGGIDLLQSILGHSSVEMSMYYSRAGREKRALKAQVTFNPADKLVAG